MTDFVIRDRLKAFLEEDLVFGDVTTELLVEPREVEAAVVSREGGVIAGIREAVELLDLVGIRVLESVKDGSRMPPGTILRMKGLNQRILMVERTLLNMMARMSGIATETARYVEAARRGNARVVIAATRKTAPGLRWLDKRAVEMGGGDAHRMALHDLILIKSNHVAEVGDAGECVRRAKAKGSFTRKVEVEVGTIQDALSCAKAGADIIMLDNMSIGEMSGTIKALETQGLRHAVLLEASGSISLENVSQIAGLGVDVISVGALTHSVRSLDLALRLAG